MKMCPTALIFSKIWSKVSQILYKNIYAIAKDILILTKVAKFTQIWSHWP